MKNKTHLIVFAVHRTSSLGVFPGSAVDDPRLKSTTVTYSSVPATRRATSKITEHMHELPDGCSLCGITRMYGCQSLPWMTSEGRPIQANIGMELNGVRSGVERRRGRVLKPEAWRRDAPGKVLKDRRSPREWGRMGTSV